MLQPVMRLEIKKSEVRTASCGFLHYTLSHPELLDDSVCNHTCCSPSELGVCALAVAGANQSNNAAVTERNARVAALRCSGCSHPGPQWQGAPPSGSQEVWPHIYSVSLCVSWPLNPLYRRSHWGAVIGCIRLNVRNQQDLFKACLDTGHVLKEDEFKLCHHITSLLLYHTVRAVTKEPLEQLLNGEPMNSLMNGTTFLSLTLTAVNPNQCKLIVWFCHFSHSMQA